MPFTSAGKNSFDFYLYCPPVVSLVNHNKRKQHKVQPDLKANATATVANWCSPGKANYFLRSGKFASSWGNSKFYLKDSKNSLRQYCSFSLPLHALLIKFIFCWEGIVIDRCLWIIFYLALWPNDSSCTVSGNLLVIHKKPGTSHSGFFFWILD